LEKKKLGLNKKYLSIFACLMIGSLTVGVLAGLSWNVEREAELGIAVGTMSMHINVYVQRVGSEEVTTIKDGVALDNAGVLTTIGKNYIEGKLGDDTPYADNAKFADDISLSSNAGAPAAGWTIIPAEIAANGLERASATYASIGDGVWTISNQFTATGAHVDVQLTGLSWDETDSLDNVLLGADTFAAVTLGNGDKLTITWTITVT